jgi:hypothetical protein
MTHLVQGASNLRESFVAKVRQVHSQVQARFQYCSRGALETRGVVLVK